MKWPSQILMVSPKEFGIEYAINPYMKNEAGELHEIDKSKALSQWHELKKTFESLEKQVHVIEGQSNLPDMVFSANQTFPILKEDKTVFLMSKMRSSYRQPEVEHFKDWFLQNNFEFIELETEQSFEGMGDLLWNYEAEELYGGYGFRTSPEVYDEVEKRVGKPLHRLELVSDDFYHLDTCLAIVGEQTAFVVKEGFSKESYDLLQIKFTQLIEIPFEEAKRGFAGNLCCLDGKNIVIQKGNSWTAQKAQELGFQVHQVDTSEFMKSGGSVFCMKQMFW